MPDAPTAAELYIPAKPTAAEWTRWALESRRPGLLIPHLQETGEIGLYPEIAAMTGVPQDPEWHPEGTVDVHIAHVLDAAAKVADREALEADARALLLFSALTHDFGKAQTTVRLNKRGRMRWTSHGHDRVGAPLAAAFLKRLGIQEWFTTRVFPLVECHMAYRDYSNPAAGKRTLRRLAARLSPASVQELLSLIEADHSGRPPLPKAMPASAVRMEDLARECELLAMPAERAPSS